MEFQNPLEEYSDGVDGALSFRDLVTEQGVQKSALRDSNRGSFEQEGFGFDFDFGRCGSTTDHVFPADDVYRRGGLLPLAPQKSRRESVEFFSFEKSNSEYLLTWRRDSVDSQSSLWSTSSSTSSSSQKNTDYGEILRLSNSKLKSNHKPSPSKMFAVWRILTLGLKKAPPMKLEDMRLRQAKTNNNINGAKNLDLRLSVSGNYYRDQKLEEKEAKAVNLQKKRTSVKEQVVVKRTPWLRGWKTLAKFPLFNRTKTPSSAVVDNGRLQKNGRKLHVFGEQN